MQNSEKILTYRMLAAALAAVAAFGFGSVAQASSGAPASIRINDQPLIDLNPGISLSRPAFKILAGLLVYDRLESDFSRGDEPVPDDDDSLEVDSVKTNDSLDDDAPDDDSLDDDSVKADDSLDDDAVKTDGSLDDDAVKTDDSLEDDSVKSDESLVDDSLKTE